MLKKLLKYDFKSVFKYWWIAALSSLALSILGGFCIQILADSILSTTEEVASVQPPAVLTVTSVIMVFLAVIGIIAFSFITMIFVYLRFYQNFFTDAGYLTFTLPVRRDTHLNSKLIMSVVTEAATGIVIAFNILLMLVIGFAEEIFNKAFWAGFKLVIKEIIDVTGWYTVIYVIEAILLLVLLTAFSALFIFACITFASMITKKAKILVAIIIYYVANGIFSFVVQIFYLFGTTTITTYFADLSKNLIQPVICIAGLGVILFVALICTLLYTFEYWMLDRKLNLA